METSLVRKQSKAWVILIPAIILLVLFGGAVAIFAIFGNSGGNKLLTYPLSEPLGEATTARFDINVGTGNITIDHLTTGEPLLASGELQYLEGQDQPTRTVDMNGHLYTLTLKANGGRQPGFQLPWATCNGDAEWRIHLNPSLPSSISVYSGGGNVELDLTGMIVIGLTAETSGGNMNVHLPDGASDVSVSALSGGGNITVELGSDMVGSNSVSAKSGAGNVIIRLPAGIAAHIHASTGIGKLNIDPQFTKIDDQTYQSSDYVNAAVKIEITVESGAGNVEVITK